MKFRIPSLFCMSIFSAYGDTNVFASFKDLQAVMSNALGLEQATNPMALAAIVLPQIIGLVAWRAINNDQVKPKIEHIVQTKRELPAIKAVEQEISQAIASMLQDSENRQLIKELFLEHPEASQAIVRIADQDSVSIQEAERSIKQIEGLGLMVGILSLESVVREKENELLQHPALQEIRRDVELDSSIQTAIQAALPQAIAQTQEFGIALPVQLLEFPSIRDRIQEKILELVVSMLVNTKIIELVGKQRIQEIRGV